MASKLKISTLIALLLVGYGMPGLPQPVPQPGSAGGSSSSGSAAMPDTNLFYLSEVIKAKKHGLKSPEYIGSLIWLGMHYNRCGQYLNAEHALTRALSIVDAGALKPSTGSREEHQIVEKHDDGTVSATVVRPPAPYEEALEQLLPALVTAEIETRHFDPCETHVKRLIALAQNGKIAKVPYLMSAYWQYASLLRAQHRDREAQIFQEKGDAINSSIKGL
jgi:hypothetical protein